MFSIKPNENPLQPLPPSTLNINTFGNLQVNFNPQGLRKVNKIYAQHRWVFSLHNLFLPIILCWRRKELEIFKWATFRVFFMP